MVDVGKCLLPERLQEARMTQQALADRLGVSRQQVNAYCQNVNVMTLQIAMNIALILNCGITDLYEWTPVPFRTKRQ